MYAVAITTSARRSSTTTTVRMNAPQALRHAAAGQRKQPERQRGVGGHRDPPALRGRAAQVEREVDRDRHAHPGDSSDHGQRQAPPLAQVSDIEFAPRLQAEHEEEERHEAAVHPLAQGQPDPVVPKRERQLGPPELLVGRRVDIHPNQGRDDGGEDDRGPARLGPQELAQRRLEPADPDRALRELVGRASQPAAARGRAPTRRARGPVGQHPR